MQYLMNRIDQILIGTRVRDKCEIELLLNRLGFMVSRVLKILSISLSRLDYSKNSTFIIHTSLVNIN